MVREEDFMIRNDGVQLIKKYDAIIEGYDAQGNPIYKPSGFMIRKVGTDDLYDIAVDVENAPFEYEETTMPIKKEEENNGEFI